MSRYRLISAGVAAAMVLAAGLSVAFFRRTHAERPPAGGSRHGRS